MSFDVLGRLRWLLVLILDFLIWIFSLVRRWLD
jgi:hypothetical protein